TPISLTRTVTSTSALDTGLTASTTYFYRVKARNGEGADTVYDATASTVTRPITISSSVAPPAEPTGITGSLDSQGVFKMRWREVTTNILGSTVSLAGYRIYKSSAM